MRTLLRSFIGLIAAVVLLAGCGESALKVDQAAFKDAPPEVKQLWADAEKALVANDYKATQAAYISLLRQPLTTKQAESVSAAMDALRKKMDAASLQGDAAAKEAMQRLIR